ncbi:SDR family oxidoreductase [Ferroplasma acidiphilum]|uniref:2, 4-dienoyl-CoA reductase (NADPH) related protein n=2 Tax=Ferroplasma TaxID=74968 RepID=S0ARJ9_FERAC|nr:MULTISPECIES: SDR family oxidoreductase [Ferroplasma]AGO60759.1 2, 4-dienoyl-CoA reductase (NADPH) precursor related protein [Ferroplasma acidarmanus Fer1]NOL59305.1 SDR family oxidoreductase [Ferroplasma acidiphilum]
MFKENLLKDKNILITGGGTGLGKQMTETFLKLGATVSIISRKEEHLTAAKEYFNNMGYKIEAVKCDIRNPDEIKNAVDLIESKTGKINVLINNAAGNFISRTEDLTPKAFDTVMGIVLHGTAYASLEMGKRWLSNSMKGTILSIVATYAWTGSGYVVPSAISKAGVLALTRSLAAEWGHKGIRTVAIAPGAFKTEGAWSRLLPGDDYEKQIISGNPERRLATKEEIANIAAFLISDMAAYINGEVVTADGGQALYGSSMFNMMESLPDDIWKMMRQR